MFGLSFANPLVLIGLAGAGIPVIIHLIHRQRAVVHRFAAIDLILRTQKRLSARFKLHQLLLLLLRMLAVACAAMALARPFLAAHAPLQAAHSATSTVIVVDDSLSMQYQRNGHAVFDTAITAALEIVAEMQSQDNGAVLVTSQGDKPTQTELTFDRAALRRRLQDIKVGYGARGPSEALLAACDLLAASKLPRKRIILCHDLTQTAWDAADLAILSKRLEAVNAMLDVLDVRAAEVQPNSAVVAVDVERGGQGQAVRVSAKLRPAEQKTTCEVMLGNKPAAKGFVSPANGAVVQKQFTLTAPPGTCFGQVALPPDRLPADDVRYFALKSSERIRALLVDGAPGTSARESETYYIERALDPSRNVQSLVQVHVVSAATLRVQRLAPFDVVALCNVPEWPNSVVSKLIRFVDNGGQILVTVGDNVASDVLNAKLGRLLPCDVRPAKTFTQEPLRLDCTDTRHPVAKSVFAQKRHDGGAVRFDCIMPPSSRLAPNAEIVLRYANGLPALLLLRHGKGHVALFTSTIDRDWTDLPIRTIFVPLVHQLLRYMTGRFDRGGSRTTLVGEPKRLRLPRHVAAAAVVRPDGQAEKLTLKRAEWYATAVATQTQIPGKYVVQSRGKEGSEPERIASFVVNVDPKESDLSRVDGRFFADGLGAKRFALLEAQRNADGTRVVSPFQTEASFGFLIAALVALILEAIVAMWE